MEKPRALKPRQGIEDRAPNEGIQHDMYGQNRDGRQAKWPRNTISPKTPRSKFGRREGSRRTADRTPRAMQNWRHDSAMASVAVRPLHFIQARQGIVIASACSAQGTARSKPLSLMDRHKE